MRYNTGKLSFFSFYLYTLTTTTSPNMKLKNVHKRCYFALHPKIFTKSSLVHFIRKFSQYVYPVVSSRSSKHLWCSLLKNILKKRCCFSCPFLHQIIREQDTRDMPSSRILNIQFSFLVCTSWFRLTMLIGTNRTNWDPIATSSCDPPQLRCRWDGAHSGLGPSPCRLSSVRRCMTLHFTSFAFHLFASRGIAGGPYSPNWRWLMRFVSGVAQHRTLRVVTVFEYVRAKFGQICCFFDRVFDRDTRLVSSSSNFVILNIFFDCISRLM